MAASDLPAGVTKLGEFQGAKGEKGNTGVVSAVTATTLAVGLPATATISGPEEARVLELGLPRGATGNTGTTGNTGPAGSITSASASALAAGAAPTVTLGGSSTARTFAFGIPAGAKGDPGVKGDTGDVGPAAPAASTTVSGIAELATSAETVTGQDAARVTTPLGVKAAFDAWEALLRPKKNRVVIIGNSNSTTTRPSTATSWTKLLCDALGWTQHNFAMDSQSLTTSGTPYLTLAQNGIGAMSTADKAEVGTVLIVGLDSDARASVGYTAIYNAMKTLLSYVRAQLPSARIVVVPHIWPADSRVYTPGTWAATIPGSVIATAKGAQDALSEFPNTRFVDQSWTWLTGRTDWMTAVGDVHPNAAGHVQIANLIMRGMEGESTMSRQLWTPVPLASGFAATTADFLARARPLSIMREGWEISADGFYEKTGSAAAGPTHDAGGPSSTGTPSPLLPAYAAHGDGHKIQTGGAITSGVPIEFWANRYIRGYGALSVGEGVLVSAKWQHG